MNCDEADGLLLDYVEGELDDSQSGLLRSHLEQCQTCRLHLRDTKKLLGVMDDVKERQEQVIERRAARRTRMGLRSQSSSTSLSEGLPPASQWKPGARLGDFEIVSEIGRGGMGVVFRARQVSLHRDVALKILPSAFGNDEKVIARFQREAQAAARLHHTNIVPVYAQGQQDGHFYYAMELIEGESLDHVIRARQEDKDSPTGAANESVSQSKIENLRSKIQASGVTRTIWTMQAHGPWRDYAKLICGAAEGLAHAHQEGVLHRDIKPQNLLLGTDNQLHITDFGLARLLDEPGMTVTGEMLGTPAYMSPEQVAADRSAIDHRTDIFSLGSTFYELLTGHRPFEGSTRDQVIARICSREPKPPRKINPRIPVDLETICLRALEKESQRRYQSAADMAADLRRYAENRPILARRVGPIEKAVKWVRRHPALTTIIVLSIGLIAGAVSWQAQVRRARHEKARELVAKAFNTLAIEDYREPEVPLQYLSQAASLGTRDVNYELTLGLANLRKNPQFAIARLQDALARVSIGSDNQIRILYLLAWAERLNSGQLEGKAKRYLDQADELGGPRTPEDYFFRGQALVFHRPDMAIASYRRAKEMRNNYTQALLQLGRGLNSWLYHERKHENFGEEVDALQSACMLQGDKAYPRYLLSIGYRISGEIYEHDGRRDDAKRNYDLALTYAREAQVVEKTSPRGFMCEAEYWEMLRDFDKAIAARNESESRCQSKDEFKELYQYRWRLYFWTGQHENALADLKRLAERSKTIRSEHADHRTIWVSGIFPALVHLEMGQREQSKRDLEYSVNSEPSSFCAITTAAAMMQLMGENKGAEVLLDKSYSQIDFAAFQQGENPAADWSRRIYVLCSGKKTLGDLQSEVGTERARDKMLWPAAYLFDACRKMSGGRRDLALQSFHRCMNTFDYDDYCYLAKVFVMRMEMDEHWPKWVTKPD